MSNGATHKQESVRSLISSELEMIENWVRLSETIGFPRSYAQIYGLCFISKDAVSAQDCVDLLKISRSSAGQGLRVLRDLGAIRSRFSLGSRVERYTIEPDLGIFIKSFMDGKLIPAFDGFFQEMDGIRGSLGRSKKSAFLLQRMDKMGRWRSKLGKARKWMLV